MFGLIGTGGAVPVLFSPMFSIQWRNETCYNGKR
ncbi:hypothetical protein B23_0667 [Geobacillus thermoleovorans B23]|nr:hypothetical protein B23_0667 [Geobacillus thermoleovorans B23]